jgi:hypothetical protein
LAVASSSRLDEISATFAETWTLFAETLDLNSTGEVYADKPAPSGWQRLLQRLTGYRAS